MDIEEYEYEMNAMINQQKEREQDFKYHEHLREKALLEIIDEQDKIINAMAKKLIETDITIEACTKLVEDCYADVFTDNSACIECIKKYYEKKVSEDK